MSTVTERIIPNTFFESVFRNATDNTLYVPWAGSHGMNIPAGEHFTVLGDPRVPPTIPRAHGVVESIRQMLKDGVIEFCSSPAVVIDNNAADGKSMALFSKNGDPYLDDVPLSQVDLETRLLPLVAPTCTFDVDKNEILIDWLTTADLDIHDKFTILVTPPTGNASTIKCGVDKRTRYIVKRGPGTYKFCVTLIAIDGRTQAGTEVEVVVPEPAPAPAP